MTNETIEHEPAEPEPADLICLTCAGTGRESWCGGTIRCETCGGSGVEREER